MNIALYVRVSTDEQAEHGTSIDMQKERLTAYAASQGWNEPKLYIDDGYTGTNAERPALKRLLRHCEQKKVDTVLVYKLDRLGRSQLVVLNLIENFTEKNIAFISMTERFDTSTPFGKAMIGILAVFAQLERDMIIERTTAGRRHRTAKGIWYGGRVPFGYAWEKETLQLTIIQEEARLVQEVYKQYLKGHSRLAIADWISSRSKARAFDHSVVREILARPVYMGKLVNAGELVDGNHEKIIDEDTWYAVQRENAKRAGGNSPIGEYLLTGLLECGECGANIVHVKRRTNKRGKEYLYELYACRNQHVREKDRTIPTCKLGYCSREELENQIVQSIHTLSPDIQKIKKLINSPSEEKSSEGIVITSLQQKLTKITNSLDNLYDAIETGEIKASRVGDRISRLEEEREAIEIQIDEIRDEYPEKKVVDIQETYSAIKQIGDSWDYLDSDDRKALLRKVVKKIVLRKGKDPLIHWNVN